MRVRHAGSAMVLLAAALVPVFAVAGPAAAAGCQSEVVAGIPPLATGCDDVTPPETRLASVTPTIRAGHVNRSTVRFDFSGTHADTGDADPITFECQFYSSVAAPAGWDPCTSPTVFSGLADSAATPYTFRVRAVDAADAAIVACDANLPCLGDPDVEDKDSSPAVATFRVDTTVPNTFLTRRPQDELTPDWPVVLTRSPRLVLNSNERGAGFVCAVNRRSRPCAEGTVTLRHLDSGSQNLTARAVDAAGNTDPTPSEARFFVPANLRAPAGSGWRRVKDGAAFDGDLVKATRVGATLRIGHQHHVRELRLIAPAGPRLGRVQVRVGRSRWYPVDLGGKPARQRTYLVRSQYSPLQSGAIVIRVSKLPRGGSIQLDALVARR